MRATKPMESRCDISADRGGRRSRAVPPVRGRSSGGGGEVIVAEPAGRITRPPVTGETTQRQVSGGEDTRRQDADGRAAPLRSQPRTAGWRRPAPAVRSQRSSLLFGELLRWTSAGLRRCRRRSEGRQRRAGPGGDGLPSPARRSWSRGAHRTHTAGQRAGRVPRRVEGHANWK